MTAQPDRDFVQSVALGLSYWSRAAANWDDTSALQDPSDWANAERVVAFGLQVPSTFEGAADLGLKVFRFAEFNARWASWIPLLQLAVQRCPADQESRLGQLQDRLGQLLRMARRVEEAVEVHQRSLQLARASGDRVLEAHCLFNLSEDHRYLNQLEQAELAGEQALACFTRLARDDPRRADVFNTLGLVAHARGQWDLAVERLQAAIAGFRAQGRVIDTARGLVNVGWAFGERGDIDAALSAFAQAEALLAPTMYEHDKVRLSLNRGTVLFRVGRHAEAYDSFRAADSGFLQRSGDRFLLALTANNLGNALLALGRAEAAVDELERAVDQWREIPDRLQLGNSLGTLGEAQAALGHATLAERLYAEALTCLAEFPDHAWAQRLQTKYQAARERLAFA